MSYVPAYGTDEIVITDGEIVDENELPELEDEETEVEKSHKIKPIDRDRESILTITNDLATGLVDILNKQKESLINIVVTKLSKDIGVDPDNLFDDMDWQTEKIFDLFGEQLISAATLGVSSAYLQINLDDLDSFELANEEAIKYAKQRSAELVGKKIKADGTIIDNQNPDYTIEMSTREMVRADIVTALEQGLSNDELAAILDENYAFTSTRALTIARTETAIADVQGNLVLYKESNIVVSKKWIVGAGCCDLCTELNGEIVDIDSNFSNSTQGPPAHPNCRCDVLPILSEE